MEAIPAKKCVVKKKEYPKTQTVIKAKHNSMSRNIKKFRSSLQQHGLCSLSEPSIEKSGLSSNPGKKSQGIYWSSSVSKLDIDSSSGQQTKQTKMSGSSLEGKKSISGRTKSINFEGGRISYQGSSTSTRSVSGIIKVEAEKSSKNKCTESKYSTTSVKQTCGVKGIKLRRTSGDKRNPINTKLIMSNKTKTQAIGQILGTSIYPGKAGVQTQTVDKDSKVENLDLSNKKITDSKNKPNRLSRNFSVLRGHLSSSNTSKTSSSSSLTTISDVEATMVGMDTRTLIEQAALLSLGVEAITAVVTTPSSQIQVCAENDSKEMLHKSSEFENCTKEMVERLARDIERMQEKHEDMMGAQQEAARVREETAHIEMTRRGREREESLVTRLMKEREAYRESEGRWMEEIDTLKVKMVSGAATLQTAMKKKEILETRFLELEAKFSTLESILHERYNLNICPELVSNIVGDLERKNQELKDTSGVAIDFEGPAGGL